MNKKKFNALKEKGYNMLDHRTRKLTGIDKKTWWKLIFVNEQTRKRRLYK